MGLAKEHPTPTRARYKHCVELGMQQRQAARYVGVPLQYRTQVVATRQRQTAEATRTAQTDNVQNDGTGH
jgi:hypothetical protein